MAETYVIILTLAGVTLVTVICFRSLAKMD